jgi:hypothetical protein
MRELLECKGLKILPHKWSNSKNEPHPESWFPMIFFEFLYWELIFSLESDKFNNYRSSLGFSFHIDKNKLFI